MKKLFSDLKWESQSVDLLIVVTQTPEYILPATSCVLHGLLGLGKGCVALDINLGCSGWVYAMSVALSLMSGGQIRRAVVVAGDARKQIPEEHDQLFGYAGTATALEYDEEAAPIMIDLGTDGTGMMLLSVPVAAHVIPLHLSRWNWSCVRMVGCVMHVKLV